VTDNEGEASDQGREDAGRTDAEGTEETKLEEEFDVDAFHDV